VFKDMARDGVPFVVMDAVARTDDWRMAGWDCAFFAGAFPDATIVHHYTPDSRTSTLAEASDDVATPSGCADPSGPQKGPQYWGIKEAGFHSHDESDEGDEGDEGDDDSADTAVSRREMPYLESVREATVLPYFMRGVVPINELQGTPEVWMSKSGAGAQAHVDGHCESTISIQLSGVKRWRLSAVPMDGRQPAPRREYVFDDGGPYVYPGGWHVSHVGELHPGEALILPPGFIHETLATSDECAASITYQFGSPEAGRYWDERSPALRRTWDVEDCHNRFAHFYEQFLDPRGARIAATGLGGLLPSEAAEQAAASHAQLDADADGCLSEMELMQAAGMRASRTSAGTSIHMFDRDRDGCVRAEELSERVERWALLERVVAEEYLGNAKAVLQKRRSAATHHE